MNEKQMQTSWGFTEGGDPSQDPRWFNRLRNLAGATVVTKNLTALLRHQVLTAKVPIMVHVTATGWGNSPVEPNVPKIGEQFVNTQALLDAGFPTNRLIVRIDPIIPTEEGIERAETVLRTFNALDEGKRRFRCRVSVMDNYRHNRDRLKKQGVELRGVYGANGNSFQASPSAFEKVGNLLKRFQQDYIFESCAEPGRLPNFVSKVGCISELDFRACGLASPLPMANKRQRTECHCACAKFELLPKKARCAHGCAYCYWR